MLAALGQLSLSLSLLLAFTCVVLGALIGKRKNQSLLPLLSKFFFSLNLLVAVSSLILIVALITSDFSLRYVWMYTNETLPLLYKFTAFWGGQEGSMLFWCLIQAVVATAAVWHLRQRKDLLPYMIVTFSAILFFFHTVMFYAENPFSRLSNLPVDGRGLNPLLQTWSMIIHPPSLYAGFILCSVPFAISIATLLSGNLDNRWLRQTRTWTILAWFFLSAGNLLGAQWAYMELGWGGFWAWDPVENAAIMPWFTTTAYIHSAMVQEKRGMLKMWNFSLLAITFCLTILGTFITRSGLITSVHTFAQSNLGYFFLVFLILCILFCFLLIFARRNQLRGEGEIDAFFCRESLFILNNILLTIVTFAILWGTLFPIFSELFTGKKITVGPPFFNSFMVPMGLGLLLLMGFGQAIPWSRTGFSRAKKLFLYPVAGFIATLLLTILIHKDFSKSGIYVLLSFSLSVFVLISLIQEFVRGTRLRHKNLGERYPVALTRLVLAARRRYGGFIVHFGILLIFLGVAGVAFKVEKEVLLQRGEKTTVGGYEIRFRDLRLANDPHKEAVYAQLTVRKNQQILELEPARFFYKNRNLAERGEPQTSTEVALHSTLFADLYTVLHSFNLETRSATFLLTLNPLVMWLWIGGFVLILGTVILIAPRRTRVAASSLALEKESLLRSIKEFEFDYNAGKMSTQDYEALKGRLVDKIVFLNRKLDGLAVDSGDEHLRKQVEMDLEKLQLTEPDHALFCVKCSMPYEQGLRYCPNCGHRLEQLREAR